MIKAFQVMNLTLYALPQVVPSQYGQEGPPNHFFQYKASRIETDKSCICMHRLFYRRFTCSAHSLLECVRCGRRPHKLPMDIGKWLEETVETAGRTTLPDQLGFPAFLHPRDKPAVERSSDRYGKRMRHSADSSILEPDQPVVAPSRKESDSAYDREEQSPSQDSNRAPSSVQEDENSNHYRRKPRRKPGPERYEAKMATESTNEHVRYSRNRSTKSKGRPSAKPAKTAKTAKKRQRDKSGLADIVQNFHAKNVPRERLTVRVPLLDVSSPTLTRAAATARHLQKRESIIPVQGARPYVTRSKALSRNDLIDLI